MFNPFSQKKPLIKSDFFDHFTDYHSHILPSVDDGVRSVEDSLLTLAEYERYGVRRVIFTPHIMEAFPENSAISLRKEFESFKSIYSGNIELSLAAEYMLDSSFEEHLNSGEVLTLWGNYLLVETSYISPPINFYDMLEAITSHGYFPILAHPERYLYMSSDELKSLKARGILFQLNLLSLSGFYGVAVEKRAAYLLENGMYDIIGSDMHNWKSFQEWISRVKLSPKREKKLRELKTKY
ncbi:MAG: CpsB/CapC family capsule biosynthesis tyrosine phosphatase [Rikenellaceae bacterium]